MTTNMMSKYILIVSLYLISFGLKETYTCPILCSCFHKTVDCSNKRKSSLPVGIPADTEILNLNNNILTSLSPDINKFKQLQELHLRGNRIKVLKEGTLQSLVNLKVIDLSSNRIQNISTRAFKDLQAPPSCSGGNCYFNFTNNPIRQIQKYAFYWTSGFGVFIAGMNKILRIESHAFYGNGVVPAFYISDVKRLVMGDSLFADFYNISRIEFVRANISKILPYTFKGVRNLSWLKFTDSSLNNVHKKAFSGLHFVKNMDEDSMYIRFEKCDIKVLPEEAFADTNVELVSIVQSTIHTVQPFVFRGASSLQTIRIQRSFIPNLSSGMFSDLNYIRAILLLQNEAINKNDSVLQIESNAFAESIKINRIRIIGQSPSTTLHIKGNAFNDLSQVKILEMGNFHSIKMEPHSLQGLVDVENLKFHNSEIPVLQTHSFSGLTRIANLHMNNIKVKVLQSDQALIPVAQKQGITNVVLEGVHLPCDCGVIRTFSQTDYLLQNNITCLYNDTQINDNFVHQTLLKCDPHQERDAAPDLRLAVSLCFVICFQLLSILFC